MRERTDRLGLVPGDDGLESFGFDYEGDSWLERLREAESPLAPGSLGPYRLVEEVHRGGQGIVYRAVETATGRRVALKRLIAGSHATNGMRRRFKREMDAAARLSHPNIVNVVGVDAGDGEPLLAMEWIDGVRISAWASGEDGTRPSVAEVGAMFVKVCRAVHHAHQRGVMHRDLKPSNILVDAAGEPHILDFGLAKQTTDSGESTSLTMTGQFIGTPAYASPEQVRGGPDAMDVRSDAYSLGVMLFEMLTGRMPYPAGGSLAEVFESIQHAVPPRPSTLRGNAGRELDAIVLKSLAKDKVARYQSVEAFGRDVQRFLDGQPIEARGDGALYLLGKTLRRHKIPVAIALAVIIVLSGLTVTLSVMYRRAERESAKALRVQRFLEDTLVLASPYRTGAELTVLEMLDLAAARIDVELAGHPEAEAGIRLKIGQVYSQFWLWPPAERHVRLALERYRELHGDDHPQVATCQTLLGRALTFLGDPAAVDVQRQALVTRRRLYGDDHPLVAETTTALAFALWKRRHAGDLHEAERLYRRALAIYDRTQEGPVDHWARALYSFGAFQATRGYDDEADALYRAAIDMFRSLEGTGDVYLVRCMQSYAHLLQKTGRYDEAAAVFEGSLARTPAGFGDADTTYRLWELGRIQHTRGKLDGADRLYRKALALSSAQMAMKYPDASRLLNEFAFRLVSENASGPDATAALDTFRAMRGLDGVDPLQLAGGLADLAALRLDFGDAVRAEALARECLEIRRAELVENDMRVADAAGLLGVCLTDLGRFADAEPLLVGAWETVRDHGEEHPFPAAARTRLVRLYEAWGRSEEADAYRHPAP